MRIHSARDDIYSGFHIAELNAVQRCYHNDPNCRVCQHGSGLLLTSAPLSAPYPNPERSPHFQSEPQGGPQGTHWYHGTAWGGSSTSPKELEELKNPLGSNDYGARAHNHWNTDLGVHLSSIHDVAKDFATNYRRNDNPNSRIAHVDIHMKNPKIYKNEDDFGREAVNHALSKGYKFLPQEEQERQKFLHWKPLSPDANEDPQRKKYYDNGDFYDRHTLDQIDQFGPDKKTDEGYLNDTPQIEEWLGLHPDRAKITDSFRKELLKKGHDGIVYGNSMEGPENHPSAIAFPETPLNIHHWEYLNRKGDR